MIEPVLNKPGSIPVPHSHVAPAADRHWLSLLLIEDDRGDAVLVEEMIADSGADIRVEWAPSLAHAEGALARERPDCVLLDLHLPDATGFDGIARVTEWDATLPVVVLTELNDEQFGVSAVASGAQDYLVKGRVGPDLLRRTLLYAIERKRAELIAVELQASDIRARENARLERGLLPSPLLLEGSGVNVVTRYRPSRTNALLGGDFYDVVQTPDRTVHIVIGDVAGHGPDEAALGVALRIAWRTLTLSGIHGEAAMRQLEEILHAEGAGRTIFATMFSLAVSPDSPRVITVRAGHPGMLVHGLGTWIGPSRQPVQLWDLPVTAGPSVQWNSPKAAVWCCSPTDCSRGILVAVPNASARTAYLTWPGRWRDCPAQSSSTRSSTRSRLGPKRMAGSATTSPWCG